MNWLKEGDRNNRVFHTLASQRRRRNAIKELVDENGHTHINEHAKARVILSYFEELYQTSSPRTDDIEGVVHYVEEKITMA